MKWIFFVLSAKKIENPESGGPNAYSNPSPSMAASAPELELFFKERKLVAILLG
jgi:hypothetical protein